jgi:hypothetical protein
MGNKFDAIYETVISRSECGGYLPGNFVKFRTNYKNTETYKHMPTILQKEVDELATCGLNIKVVQVGDKQSGFSAGNQFKPATQMVVTIAADHGGGRTYGRVTVCPDMIDIVEVDNFGTGPVPDKFKRKDVVIIKPKPLKVDPNLITNVTDKGNGKNTPTNLKLAGESTKFTLDGDNIAMLYESMYNSESENLKIDDRTRNAITSLFTINGLDGNGRFETVGKALAAVQKSLDTLGFELDMVTNDIEVAQAHHHPGMKKQMLIPFRRKSTSGDPFDEEPEIENSAISFNFENLGRSDNGPNIEVVAYAS